MGNLRSENLALAIVLAVVRLLILSKVESLRVDAQQALAYPA